MTRQPHARRVYLPPERPEERVRWGDILGLLAVVVIGVVLVVLVPLLVSPGAPW